MSTRTITVFGGTGFLGRAIVRELVDAGHRVRIAARHPRLPDWAEDDDRLELVRVDLREAAAVEAALSGAQGAVNAVSLYVEQRHTRFTDLHVVAAGQLARLAHAAGVETLIQISGIGVDRPSPSPYVRARAAGETAVVEAFPRAILLRPSVLFGPEDAFIRALARLARLPAVPLFGRGLTRLQPVHVTDVARAVGRLLGQRPPPQRLYELGGPEVLRYRDALGQVMAYLERTPPLIPIPFPLWHLAAGLLAGHANPPLTRDQLWLMAADNVVNPALGNFAHLGILPRTLRDSLPHCLSHGLPHT